MAHKFQRIRINIRFEWIVFILSIVTSCIIYNFLVLTLREYNFYPRRICLIHAIEDTLIIYLPFIFLRTRRFWLLCIPAVVIPLIVWAETIYFRNFQNLIPGKSVRLLLNIDEVTIRSLQGSIETIDFYYVIPILIVLLIIFIKRKFIKIIPFRKISIIAYCCITGLSMLVFYLMLGHYNNGLINRFDNPKSALRVYGMDGLTCFTIIDCFSNSNVKLRDDERVKIVKFFNDKNNKSCLTDTLLWNINNKNKNLILIIVESFNNSVIEADSSLEICPYIHEIVRDSSTIYTKINPKVYLGRSSDGVFTINTGLIPLVDEPWVCVHSVADYPSLAKALSKHSSVEIICENPEVWRHFEYSKSLGYDNLMSFYCSEFTDPDIYLFEKSIPILKQLRQPFFAEITTIGMHDGYTSPHSMERIDVNKLRYSFPDFRDRNYLQDVRSFDEGLRRFISLLKENDLYDSSVIVITSDHEARVNCLSDALNQLETPLIILNSGISHALNYHGVKIEQNDIFPTIIDIMSIDNYIPSQLGINYRGVGKSLFRDEPLCEDGLEISRLLIKKNFFSD